MRIIAGQRRGHKIDGPRASAGTRPTSDMVRESLFNILGDRVADRLVIDLFAGTGALGLEALSRGAKRAIFLETNRHNVELIRRNIATLRYQDRAWARHADAYRWARSFRPDEDEGRPLVILLDPPYREYEIHSRHLNHLLRQIVEKAPPGSIVALESGRTLGARILSDFDEWDVRRYGNTHLAFRTISPSPHVRAAPEAAASPEETSADPSADTEPETKTPEDAADE